MKQGWRAIAMAGGPFKLKAEASGAMVASEGQEEKERVAAAGTTERALGVRKKGMGARLWLRIDEEGKTEVIEADKYAIMRKVSIPARDLRILDPLLSYPSTVLGREKAIVVNLEHIKGIITAEEVLLLNWQAPEVRSLVEDLRQRLPSHFNALGEQMAGDGGGGLSETEMNLSFTQGKQNKPPQFADRVGDFQTTKPVSKGDLGQLKVETEFELEETKTFKRKGPNALPFEFRALEVCLEAACGLLDKETTGLEQEAYPALEDLTQTISTLNLEKVRKIKSRLVTISGRVQKVRDELEQLLDDDEDMNEMYLTEKKNIELGGGLSHSSSGGAFSLAPPVLKETMKDKRRGGGGGGGELTVTTSNAHFAREAMEPKEEILSWPTSLERSADAASHPLGSGGPLPRPSLHQKSGDFLHVPPVSLPDSGPDTGHPLTGFGAAFRHSISSTHPGDRSSTTSSSHGTGKSLDVEELEMLLEAYFVQIEGSLNKLSTLREYVDDTEDYINIMLDDKQNSLLQMNVFLTTATLFISMFVVVTGIFGMNVKLSLFEPDVRYNHYVFYWVVAGCSFGAVVLYSAVMAYIKKRGLIG